MSFRVRCNRCTAVAVIRDSAEQTPDYKTLYCSCSNPHCGHTFTMDLTFGHTLSPSAMDLSPGLCAKLETLSRQQQQELFASFS